MSRGWLHHGHDAVSLDIEMDTDGSGMFDLLTVRGFFLAVSQVRRLVPRGLLFAGVPCSSWARLPIFEQSQTLTRPGTFLSVMTLMWQGFINRSTSGRTAQRPLGDETRRCTRSLPDMF